MKKKTKFKQIQQKIFQFIKKSFFSNIDLDFIQESVETLIEEKKSNGNLSDVGELEIEILENIFSYKDLSVDNIMVPRIKVDGISVHSTKEEVIRFIKEKHHTRFPVFKDSLDNVIGYINIKDIIAVIFSEESFSLKKLVRPLMVVPNAMRIITLLSQMRKKKIHIALVVDEYGGTDGIITIEDLLEEIIGELEDEHDSDKKKYVMLDENTISVSAEMELDEFEKIFNIVIDQKIEDDCNTIGGMILSIAGKVPQKGEILKYSNLFECEILDSDPRKIKRMMIKRNAEENLQ